MNQLATASKSMGNVEMKTNELEDALCFVDTRINALEDKLRPILNDASPTVSGGADVSPPVTSSLAEILQQRITRARNLGVTLESITERIDL